MTIPRAVLGVAFFCLVAWLLSSDRRRVPWRVVGWGLGLQVLLAWWVLGTAGGARIIDGSSAFFRKLISMTDAGTQLVDRGAQRRTALREDVQLRAEGGSRRRVRRRVDLLNGGSPDVGRRRAEVSQFAHLRAPVPVQVQPAEAPAPATISTRVS